MTPPNKETALVQGTSRDDFIYFLRCQVEDGKVPINTGLSRVTSVRKILTVLSDEEAEDVTNLDVDAIILRFFSRSDHQYSLASRVSYRSRLRSALEDFTAAQASPSQVRQGGQKGGLPSVARVAQNGQSIRVPLARGCTVIVDNLPIDLSVEEAARIAKVLAAYAMVAD